MQVTAQNREIIPPRWEHLILSLDPKGIVVHYLFLYNNPSNSCILIGSRL